ncbi:MAG TPA: alpha/beta hydrolase-fold protein [Longimicrobiales bacterium]|nr:alpha/beta hydrolase-fold protein [Longimicrobiales bacterium]
MLDYDLHAPAVPREGAPLVVLLHGRGADKDDLAPLRRFLPDDAFLATPRAPFEGAPWGYGPGWAWYRYVAEDRPEPASFSGGQEALDQLLDALPARLPVTPGPLIVGGFSQGGTASLAWALRHPGRAAGVAVLSGFLADHPDVRADPSTVADTAIFWGHGTVDPAIPFALARKGRAALRAAGAALTERDYPMGHGIEAGEMKDLREWLDGVLDGGATPPRPPGSPPRWP